MPRLTPDDERMARAMVTGDNKYINGDQARAYLRLCLDEIDALRTALEPFAHEDHDYSTAADVELAAKMVPAELLARRAAAK
jgi:hypothetical protein